MDKSRPLLIAADKSSRLLERAAFTGESKSEYDEAWLQEHLYSHPEIIPAGEIDDSYATLVPLCREMNTPAGPTDVIYATPTGRIALLEAKLWRNPESRRKVVAQLLDYVKELTRWDFAALDAAVTSARRAEHHGATSGGLLDTVRAAGHNVDEPSFIDAVTRNLRRGELLLMIVGDGIREGVGAITEFLEDHGNLHFTFGLIEMAIYRDPAGGHLLQPRVVYQSVIARRFVFQTADGTPLQVATSSDAQEDATDADNPELARQRETYETFWREFLSSLRLDNQDQPISAPARNTNQYFRLPSASTASISAYVAQSSGEAGVYLTFSKGPTGDRIYQALLADRATVDAQLDVPVDWQHGAGGKGWVVSKKAYPGVLLQDHRQEIQTFMRDRVNRFVNVFRPRIERLGETVA